MSCLKLQGKDVGFGRKYPPRAQRNKFVLTIYTSRLE